MDAIDVTVSASDDVELIAALHVIDRLIVMSDSHGTAADCPWLGDDVRVQIGGGDVDDDVLRRGLVPADDGEIDLRPDFMEQQAARRCVAPQCQRC